jgi:hypothetical protein
VISDRRGFEYVELGPQSLPGAPAGYLDVHPSGNADPSYGFELLEIAGRAFVRYSRYLRINPNDSQTNRGAYLSVGFLAARALPLHVGANCMDLVSQVVGHLKSTLGPDNSFDRNFRLADYAYNGDLSESAILSRCSPLLALDVLMQGLNAQGSLPWRGRRPIFIDAARLTREEEIDKHLFYFGKGTPAVQLRLERDREKLKRLARQLAHAASYADQVQDEWLSYQSDMQERLPAMAARGTELRDLIDEVEYLTESVDGIGASGAAAAPAFGAAPQPASADAIYPGPGMQRPRGAAVHAHRFQTGARYDRRSRRRFRSKFRTIAIGIGAAVVITGLVALTLGIVGGQFAPDESVTAAPPAEHLPPGDLASPPSDQESTSTPPATDGIAAAPSSVAQERAALGQSRPQ